MSIFFTLEFMLVMMNRQKVYGKLYMWVPGISQKIGYWQMEHPFSSYIVQIFFFGILDDLSKFRSTFGMVNFVKNHPICNMPKVTKLLMAKYERNRQEALVFEYMICH